MVDDNGEPHVKYSGVFYITGRNAYGDVVMEEWHERPVGPAPAYWVSSYRTWGHRLVHWGEIFVPFKSEFEAVLWAKGQGRRCKYLGEGHITQDNNHGDGSDAQYFVPLN